MPGIQSQIREMEKVTISLVNHILSNPANLANLANPANPANPANLANLANPANKPTYSQMAARGLQKPQQKKEGKIVVIKLQPSSSQPPFDALATRDLINSAVGQSMVAKVTQSQKGNIVLQTTKATVKDLLEARNQWITALKEYTITTVEEPTEWSKLVAHGVPIEPGLQAFISECQEFTDITVAGVPRWLVPHRAINQSTSSVVFSVKTPIEKALYICYGL